MDNELKAALAEKLLALGDDEMILGHRDSEWCGHAPILEEDIAFANIALDEQGHAAIWYSLHAEVIGQDRGTYPDKLVFLRLPDEFRSAPLMELPKGDWAFSMLRQYLFDAAENVLLERLVKSSYEPFAEAAAKVQKEEFYHLRHTQAWVRRLGLGTHESSRRMQTALDALWPYVISYFDPLAGDAALVEAQLVPPAQEWQSAWETQVRSCLQAANLKPPQPFEPVSYSRTLHSEHLTAILNDVQSVARLQPDARW